MPPPYCYDHPRPSVSVDLVVFTLAGEELRILMIRRKSEPYAGYWAIPGGFLELDESAEAAALRELREETGLEGVENLSPIGFFAAVDRDPRGRVISLAHAGVVRGPAPMVQGADDATEASWVDPRQIEAFAFDHKEILATALHWLIFQVQTGTAGLNLLPEVFTLADIRRLFQAIGGTPQTAAAWRKRMEKSGAIAAIAGMRGKYREKEPSPMSLIGTD